VGTCASWTNTCRFDLSSAALVAGTYRLRLVSGPTAEPTHQLEIDLPLLGTESSITATWNPQSLWIQRRQRFPRDLTLRLATQSEVPATPGGRAMFLLHNGTAMSLRAEHDLHGELDMRMLPGDWLSAVSARCGYPEPEDESPVAGPGSERLVSTPRGCFPHNISPEAEYRFTLCLREGEGPFVGFQTGTPLQADIYCTQVFLSGADLIREQPALRHH
jgi:hypothetical protein